MENASDALKIGAAILIFVIMLSVAFVSISQARETSDIITFALDKTNFYPQYKEEFVSGIYKIKDAYGNEIMELDKDRNRIVGVDTIISTIYRYHEESLVVIINDKTGAQIGRFDMNTEDEVPWRGKPEWYNKRIDFFISGKNDEGQTINANNTKINDGTVKFGGPSGQRDNATGAYYIAEKPLEQYVRNSARFKQEFTEVFTSGIYETAEDGSQITITPGGKTVYITYTEI